MKKKNTIIREEARKCYGDLLNYTKFNLTSSTHVKCLWFFSWENSYLIRNHRSATTSSS